MSLPGTPHTAKCAVLWTTNNETIQCENTFYLRDASDAMFGSPDTTAAGLLAIANTDLLPAYHPEAHIVGLSFEDVRTFPFGGIVASQTPVAGTAPSAGQPLPSGCCIAVKKSTATLGRAGRGRWYHPVLDTNGIFGGQDKVSGAFAAIILTQLNAFQTGVEAFISGGEMGIVSYHLAGALRVAGLFSPITNWSFSDLNIDSQRRRLAGRGS